MNKKFYLASAFALLGLLPVNAQKQSKGEVPPLKVR